LCALVEQTNTTIYYFKMCLMEMELDFTIKEIEKLTIQFIIEI
jgi:hypothetical protein